MSVNVFLRTYRTNPFLDFSTAYSSSIRQFGWGKPQNLKYDNNDNNNNNNNTNNNNKNNNKNNNHDNNYYNNSNNKCKNNDKNKNKSELILICNATYLITNYRYVHFFWSKIIQTMYKFIIYKSKYYQWV